MFSKLHFRQVKVNENLLLLALVARISFAVREKFACDSSLQSAGQLIKIPQQIFGRISSV